MKDRKAKQFKAYKKHQHLRKVSKLIAADMARKMKSKYGMKPKKWRPLDKDIIAKRTDWNPRQAKKQRRKLLRREDGKVSMKYTKPLFINFNPGIF